MSSPQCDTPACQEAADRAVKKVFAILGVDIDSPAEVEAFREDLRFGRRMRRVADQGAIAFIGVVAAGFAAALWAGITKYGGH